MSSDRSIVCDKCKFSYASDSCDDCGIKICLNCRSTEIVGGKRSIRCKNCFVEYEKKEAFEKRILTVLMAFLVFMLLLMLFYKYRIWIQ